MKLANPPGAQFEILVDGKPFRARRNGGRPWQRQSASARTAARDGPEGVTFTIQANRSFILSRGVNGRRDCNDRRNSGYSAPSCPQ